MAGTSQIDKHPPSWYGTTPEECYQHGLQSNIPECCVKFYITVWVPKYLNSKYKPKFLREHTNKMYSTPENRSRQYIPCPDCLERGVINELKIGPYIRPE